MDLVRIVADEASHARLLNALAINTLLWGLWVVWFTWRQTKRVNDGANGKGANRESVPL